MIDNVKFATLLKMQESNVLDFKAQMFEMDADDKDYTKTAKLAKDVISFINTIRTETSYMIIGVKAHVDGSKDLLGIDKHVDEAIIQSKLQGKIFPTPKFAYYPFDYEGKSYGVFEFPVQPYDKPLATCIRMKGLAAGQVFHKVGSRNTEADTHTAIGISDWLRLLENKPNTKSVSEIINEFIMKASNQKIALSQTITEVHLFAKQHKYEDLLDFCHTELSGLPYYHLNELYRMVKTGYCYGRYTEKPNFTQDMVVSYLTASGQYLETAEIIKKPISDIELMLNMNKTNNHYAVEERSITYLYPHHIGENKLISIFRFRSSAIEIYGKIRKELIRQLLNIN